MDGGTRNERHSEKTQLHKDTQRQEVVESHENIYPESTCHIEGVTSKILLKLP